MTRDIGRENSTRGVEFEDKYYTAFSGYPLETSCEVSKHAKAAAEETRRHFRRNYSFKITEIEQTNTKSKLQKFVRAKIEDPADIAFKTDSKEFYGISLKYGGESVTIKQPGLNSLFEIFEGNTAFLKETLKNHAREIEEITREEIDPSLPKQKKHKLFKSAIRDDSPIVGLARRKNMEYRQLIAKVLGESFNKLSLDKKERAMKNLFNLSKEDVIKTIIVHYNTKKNKTDVRDPYKYFEELSRDTRDVVCEVNGTILKFLCLLKDGRRFHFISCQIKNRSGSPFTSILGNVRKGSRKDHKET